MWVNLGQVGSGSYCVEALHQTQKDSAEIQHEPWGREGVGAGGGAGRGINLKTCY